MRMPRIRPKLWMLMAAVAVVGAASALEVMRLRRVRYLAAAAEKAFFESGFREGAEEPLPWCGEDRTPPHVKDRLQAKWRAEALATAASYAAQRAKYERAARYPFLPVAPDPPEPE